MTAAARIPGNARQGYRTVKFGSDQATQQSNQAAALLLRSNGDAEKIFDPRFVEMPYQNAAPAKLGGEIRAAMAAMAREYEVRRGRQNLEAEFGERAGQRLPGRHDALACLVKP